MPSPPEKKQPLLTHLVEFRRRLIYSLFSLIGGMLVCLFFSKEIFTFLQRPLLKVLPTSSSFIATGPLEAFITYLKVALLAGLFLSSPFILYQIWQFVAPGLYQREKKIALLFVTLSTLCFVGGGLFGYYIIFPVGFRFFVTPFEGTEIRFLPQMKEYLGFIAKVLLTFGAIFEIPLFLVLLARIGLIRREMLTKARRYVLVLMFLIAGVLTPGPDIFSQFLLAVPLLVLYELSILAVWILEKRG